LDKPLVDKIEGIAPAVAIEQKVNTSNPRSTVGSTTEIYDYLKLLFARIGTTYSPFSGEKVTKDSVENVIDVLKELPEGTKCILLAPVEIKERSTDQILKLLAQQGYARIKVNGIIERIQGFEKEIDSHFELVVDRILLKLLFSKGKDP
jgi:excinuclease ABC subunit A